MISKYKEKILVILTTIVISFFSIIFTRPLLEDWGIISWFRNAPLGIEMWNVWLTNSFDGTPARPFQIIAWVMGIQVGKLLPYSFDQNSIFGIAAIHGFINSLKFVITWKCIPKNISNFSKWVICLLVIYPAVWPSLFNPQSLSSQFSSLLYLVIIYFLLQFYKTNRIHFLFGLAVTVFALLTVYQGLILCFFLSLIYFFILETKSERSNREKFLKIFTTITTATLLYGFYLLAQFLRIGKLGYETSGATPQGMFEILMSLLKSIGNIYPTVFRESPILNAFWFFSIYFLLKELSRTKLKLYLSVLFLVVTPLTSVIFFVNLEWINDPNRVLFVVSFAISTLILFLINSSENPSEVISKTKVRSKTKIKYLNHSKKISVFLLVILLAQIMLGIYQRGSLVLTSYSNQKDLITVVKDQIDFTANSRILIRDYSQEVGDYYFFFGAGSVLNTALSAEGIDSDITFCTPSTSSESFKVKHRQALIRKIGTGPQTHPGSCFEGRFLNGHFDKTYNLRRFNKSFQLTVFNGRS